MSGFHRNKGIVIELTALLDVIFIMLFWVMINVQDKNEQVKEQAESQVAQAQAQEQKAKDELKEISEQKDKQIEEAWAYAESLDSAAAKNQQALAEYEDGMLITLDLKYEKTGELYIFDKEGEIGKAGLGTEEEIYNGIVNSLERTGMNTDEVVLCAMVYDGSRALYKDVNLVTDAVDRVNRVYKNFYCTYINTAR